MQIFVLYKIYKRFGIDLVTMLLMILLFHQFSPWSCLRNCQVRNGYCSDECHETRADYEIHHPRRHGWYYCHLRSGRRCPYCRFSWGALQISAIQVSIIFRDFSQLQYQSCDHRKKINDQYPLHSHLLMQLIYTINRQQTHRETLSVQFSILISVRKWRLSQECWEIWRESDNLINLPIGKNMFAGSCAMMILLNSASISCYPPVKIVKISVTVVD